ncbi:hypothetical protein DZS_27810 [Dickeya ananatis]
MKEHAQYAPLAQFIQAFRHELHQHPELSNQEFETTKKNPCCTGKRRHSHP